MRKVFDYASIDQAALATALEQDGRVELALPNWKAWACLVLLDNLNRVRSYSIGPSTPSKRLCLLRDSLFGILLSVYAFLACPRVLTVLGFYVEKQPAYEIRDDHMRHLIFKRLRHRGA